ncbi:OstA-like domain protein [Leptospira ryugenii]|uniref:OstA-like domain protein n=1 Tax=Leptospira ryugenii TaxID=1917863 RepID=A0A2P2DWM5_9LEPT|nr:LptA/OstA family protein [Leptospira ryugenii]GBF49045.1 OstA-like domain protein [Leptospira ryugenii]
MKECLLIIFFALSIKPIIAEVSLEPPILFGSEDLFYQEKWVDPNIPEKGKKKSQIPVMWGGNSLTQEEKLINGFQMKTFILGGGAYITHKNIQLIAREIEIIGEDALLGNLKGQVQVEDRENGATLIASKGHYDKIAGTVTLENSPTLIHKKDNKIVKIQCESIVRYLDDAKTVLSGKVVVTSSDFRVFGEDAVFYEKEDRIDLSNEPFLFSENRFIQGKTLSYFVKEGSIVLEGDASIYQVSYENNQKRIADEKKKEKQSQSNKTEKKDEEKLRIVTIFSGNQLRHKNRSGSEDAYTSMNGNAFMFRSDSEFKADEIQSKNNNQLILSKGQVSFLDKKNAYQMEGGYLEYDKTKGYSYLSEKPKILFLDEKTLTEKGNLTAVFIERFEEKKEAVARGDVQIQTQSSQATGEYATYYEKENRLELEGNPNLIKDKTKVSAGRIIIYPNEDRAILTDGLKVIGNDPKN